MSTSWKIWIHFLAGVMEFSSITPHKNGCGAHQTSDLVDTGSSFLEIKGPEHEAICC
jgi:hypothetical protein